MIPVEQRQMAVYDEHGDCVQHGDCLTACVASLLELPLDQVPFFVESKRWWNEYQDFFRDRGLCLDRAWITVDEDDPTKLSGWPGDRYWIATVKSPRAKSRCSGCKGTSVLDGERCGWCDGGLSPSLHAVVMFGREIVWDPHPQRAMGHLGFISGEQIGVPDPARVELKAAA